MADPTDPKTSAIQGFVASLKALGIEVAEDLTSPEAQKTIDAALSTLWPKANAIIEAFSPGWLGVAEKMVLPWAEGKAQGIVDKAIQNLHAHLASSTVAEVPASEAQALKAGAPAVQAVHASPEEAAGLKTIEEERAFVAAHQPTTGTSA